MSLTVLIAGCLPKERRDIESLVRKAFGDTPESNSWSASLVKIGSSWSVSLEGRNQVFNLTAPEDRLLETITEALGANGTANTPAELPMTLEELDQDEGLLTLTAEKLPNADRPTSSATKKSLDRNGARPLATRKSTSEDKPSEADTDGGDRYKCSACERFFKIVYSGSNREKKTNAPAACPHCWHLAKVSVPESAAITEEYRAEAIPT